MITENMVGAICVAVVLVTIISCAVWLIDRREERESRRQFRVNKEK